MADSQARTTDHPASGTDIATANLLCAKSSLAEPLSTLKNASVFATHGRNASAARPLGNAICLLGSPKALVIPKRASA